MRIWVEEPSLKDEPGRPRNQRLVESGGGRFFPGRSHVFLDVTDRPCPAITQYSIAVAVTED